jgi:hypothetical protein
MPQLPEADPLRLDMMLGDIVNPGGGQDVVEFEGVEEGLDERLDEKLDEGLDEKLDEGLDGAVKVDEGNEEGLDADEGLNIDKRMDVGEVPDADEGLYVNKELNVTEAITDVTSNPHNPYWGLQSADSHSRLEFPQIPYEPQHDPK